VSGPRTQANRRLAASVPARSTRLRVAAGVLLGGALLAVSAAALRQLADPATLPIREVRIEGEFRHLAPARLQAIVAAEVRGGFLRVHVDAIRAALLGEPWVEDATVRRVWPDRLQISVREQRPVALWGAKALLNDAGSAFHPEAGSLPSDLPRLSGPEGSERQVLERYRQTAAVLGARGLRVSEFALNARGAWRLRLAQGAEVIVGRSEFRRRLTRFALVAHRILEADGAGAVTVDLRYTNGLAVGPGESGAAAGA